MRLLYAPGPWTAVVGEGLWLLVERGEESVLAAAGLPSAERFDAVADAVERAALSGAAVTPTPEGVRVAMWGEAVVTVDGDRLRRARTLIDPGRITLTAPTSATSELRLLEPGTVGAEQLVIDFGASEETVPPEPAAPTVPAGSPGIIDGLPWETGQWSHAPEPATQPNEPDQRDTETVAMSTAPPVIPPPPAPPPPPGPSAPPAPPPPPPPAPGTEPPAPVGPHVWAVVCPSGHWSSPSEERCRVCGTVLPPQQPQPIPRPPLGRLVLSGGGSVVLDRTVLLGRAPTSDEQAAALRPHLVRLTASEVSRLHCEVVVDGWQVLVRDLGSTNGTAITRVGQPIEQLRPHEAYPIEVGTVISLTDDVTATYQAVDPATG